MRCCWVWGEEEKGARQAPSANRRSRGSCTARGRRNQGRDKGSNRGRNQARNPAVTATHHDHTSARFASYGPRAVITSGAMYANVPTREHAPLRASCFEYLPGGPIGVRFSGRGARRAANGRDRWQASPRRAAKAPQTQQEENHRIRLFRSVSRSTKRAAHPKSQILTRGSGRPSATCSSVFSSLMSRLDTPWGFRGVSGLGFRSLHAVFADTRSCHKICPPPTHTHTQVSTSGAGDTRQGIRGPTFLWQ